MLQCVLVLGLWSLVCQGFTLDTDKPPVPKFTSVRCTDTYEITVSFDRGPPRPDWLDDYQVTLTYNSGESHLLCKMTINQTDPRWHDSVLSCTKKMESYVVDNNPVTLSILVARPSLNHTIHNVTTSETYSLTDYIVPSAVQELSATSIGATSATISCIGATSATISWRLSQYLADLMWFMGKMPLEYRMIVNKTDGVPELWNVTVKKRNLDYNSRYVHVELVNLTSYTSYTVTVFGIAGGGEGERQEIGFTTGMSVPTTPPKIENFSYSWIYSLDNKVLIMWNHLSRDAIGGNNFTYQVEVTVGQVNPTTQFVKKPHFVQKLSSLSEPITFKVWSVNEGGRSVNHSTLVIPKEKHFHQEEASEATVTFVDRDHVIVNISLEDVANKEMVAVHWCQTEKDQSFGIYNVCKDQLMTHTEEFNKTRITNKAVYTVPVNVRMNRQEQQGSRMNRQITYYESTHSTYDRLSGSLTNATIYQAGSVAHTDGADTEGQPDIDKMKFFHSVMEGGHWSGMVHVNENSVLNKATKEIQTNVIAVLVACVTLVFIIGLIIFMYFGVKKCIKRRRYFNTHVAPPILADQMEPMIQETLGYYDDRTGSSNGTESGLGASVADTDAPSQGSALDTSARSYSTHTASTNGQGDYTNGQQNSTNGQQNSTNSQQNSTNGQQNSTNGQHNSTNGQQNSTNGQHSFTNGQHDSTSSGSRSGTRTSGHHDSSTTLEAGLSTGSRVGNTSSCSDLEQQRQLVEELGLEMCFDPMEDEG